MPAPYLSQLGSAGGLRVWMVDGSWVRGNLDEEFSNFGQHYRFEFIPESEFWIDTEAAHDETRFFIDHLLIEYRLMKKGMTYPKALEAADRTERAERAAADASGPLGGPPGGMDAHEGLLGTLDNGVEVWLVNGQAVRDGPYIDFTEGGHDLRYAFIPEGEIWIDDDVEPAERPYILLHEAHERDLMESGVPYDRAHKASSQLEWQTRHHPEMLPQRLADEGAATIRVR